MKLALTSLLLTLALLGTAFGQNTSSVKHILFFSKASSWEQKIVHRDGDKLSYLETVLQKLGKENNIDFTFSKDGRIFNPKDIAKFDAFFFFTSGDPTAELRNGNGRGDNYPLMTLEGKKAFLDAIQNGKGFIGCNTANYTFTDPWSPGEKKDATNAWRYIRMLGSGYMGHNKVQQGHFSYLDLKFPGMENVPADYSPVDQWYAFNRLMPDIHVIMALDCAKLTGNLYGRPDYPVTWARMEGKGRVFYTTMGHSPQIWEDPVFLRMLLGGIRWADGSVEADVTPDISKITPQANEIPKDASEPDWVLPPPNPHFPNFEAHFSNLFPNPEVPLNEQLRAEAPKNVLIFTKSAGYEHPVVYRDTGWPGIVEISLWKLGHANNIEFTFSKDGGIFTPENIAKFDAFLFFTSGDLTSALRDGWGDNYPPMTAAGKEAFLQAIRDGKGFIGVHCAIDTFSDVSGSTGSGDSSKANRYLNMLGARYIGHNEAQNGYLIQVDKQFPGMEQVPADYLPFDQWYALKNFRPDLHVIMALNSAKMTGNLYGRPNYPIAWARMEGKGRVFYTGLGDTQEIWQDPVFQQMILGGVRWVTGTVDADITPNLSEATPQANKIPKGARKVISSDPAQLKIN